MSHPPVDATSEQNYMGTSDPPSKFTTLLSTAVIYMKDRFGIFQPCRSLLDVGSSSCFVTNEFADLLKIRKEKVSISVSCLSGVSVNVKYKLTTEISNRSDYEKTLGFFIVPKINDMIPDNYFNPPSTGFPRNIKLADPGFNKPGRIDVLLGAECFYELLRADQIQLPNTRLILQNSVFGYIVGGSIPNFTNRIYTNFAYCDPATDQVENSLRNFWELESIGIKDDPKYKEKDEALDIFNKTVCFKDGRYEVSLPWKRDWKELEDNFSVAEKRFNNLKRRMQKYQDLFVRYNDILEDYLKQEIVEKVLDHSHPNDRPVFYLPHQAVFRQESVTTKMRIVFDASSHEIGQLSLNDCLWTGINLNPSIFQLLTYFRLNKVAILADVEKAFLQISLAERDRDAVRFIFTDSDSVQGKNDDVQVYRFKRVLFGVNASPFLLAATIKTHVEKFRKIYPSAAKMLDSCFYVDDLIAGEDNIADAYEVSRDGRKIMKEAGMNLRKWVSNAPNLMKRWEEEGFEIAPPHSLDNPCANWHKVLGLSWDIQNDQLNIDVRSLLEFLKENKITKRFVLQAAGRIFDPTGLVTPFTIRLKCLFQELWLRKVPWDTELPTDIRDSWLQWCSEVSQLSELRVPRFIHDPSENECNVVEIHSFSDASQKAYGAAVYLKVKGLDGKICVNLVASKSRVAPLKKISLPRLELLGALLAARLTSEVRKAIDRKATSTTFYWTDSKVTLFWIKGSSRRWKPFVANRVNEIQSLTEPDSWFHCPGKDNPADLLTRGTSVKSLLESSKWWTGPTFLREPVISTIATDPEVPEEDYSQELKKSSDCDKIDSVVTLTVSNQNLILNCLLDKSTNYMTILRVLSYIYRFVHNAKNKDKRRRGFLTKEEVVGAEKRLIRLVQRGEFSEEIKDLEKGKPLHKKSNLVALNCFLDSDGLLRVGGRLFNSNLDNNAKFPIVLPSKHPLTLIILKHYHLIFLHIGPQSLLYHVRQKFWPLNGRNNCRKVVFECVKCFKSKPIMASQIMGNLPKERVVPTYPFNHTGIDFCGPFFVKLKNQRKGVLNKIYICIFVCLCTRAIHLDFVTDLTSQAFIACLKRFFGRRGKCSKIFSDNAKNFIGADAELKRLHNLVKCPDDNLAHFYSGERIEWEFIPPKSPNFGGLWEAGVKSFKFHLKRVTGNSNLTLEEFLTVVAEIEGVLNSRPLTPLSSDCDNFETLSPGHFLIGRPISSIAEPQCTDINENRLSRWKRVTKFSQQIWKLWKRDYLNNLQQRNKWRFYKDNVKIGTLVLIKEENLPSTQWMTGRISEVFYGGDKRVRVVNVKLPNGKILKRNIRNICILPIE